MVRFDFAKLENLNGYYIGVYPITEAQYDNVMGAGAAPNHAYSGPHKPVVKLSYNQIRSGQNATLNRPNNAPSGNSFLAKLRYEVAQANGGVQLPFDLPTECQWEFAVRAGTTGSYGIGPDTATVFTTLTDMMNYLGNSTLAYYNHWQVTPSPQVASQHPGAYAVGSKPTVINNAGLLDTHGNVWEWCLDVVASGSTQIIAGTNPMNNVGGATTCSVRGGSWNDEISRTRSAYRGALTHSTTQDSLGFRLATAAGGPKFGD